MTGLQTLRIKETDRIAALQNELAKIGATLEEKVYDKEWFLSPSTDTSWKDKNVSFHTYEDHRMAMAFAPLATLAKIIIEDPNVVEKSYPTYWRDLADAGFNVSEQ
jgi:3-phosphoshikimate 1-carboxyvinyltransferase